MMKLKIIWLKGGKGLWGKITHFLKMVMLKCAMQLLVE